MHTHTRTFLLLQRSFSPRRGNTITGRTERNSLDEQKTTGTCWSSVAQPVHRRCVSRRKTIKQVWNSVRELPRLVCIFVSAGLWHEIRPNCRPWVWLTCSMLRRVDTGSTQGRIFTATSEWNTTGLKLQTIQSSACSLSSGLLRSL